MPLARDTASCPDGGAYTYELARSVRDGDGVGVRIKRTSSEDGGSVDWTSFVVYGKQVDELRAATIDTAEVGEGGCVRTLFFFFFGCGCSCCYEAFPQHNTQQT
jgi:hypothetical protein